jgi:GNAT superfamily N-acetyltransferase
MRSQYLHPALATELWLPEFDSEVLAHDGFIAVRTPSNPTFYWGNCLYLADNPADADLALWLARFDAAVKSGSDYAAAIQHVAIGTNALPGTLADLPSWRAARFEAHTTSSLCLSQPQALKPSTRLPTLARFAPLDLVLDLPALLDVECSEIDGYEPEGYRQFRHRQHLRHQAMQTAGLAQWFGMWCGDELAAVCGLLRRADQVRFQNVVTKPEHRRKGLCTALISHTCQWAFSNWQTQQLWMMADPHDVAIGIYESLGFARQRDFWSLQRRAPQDSPAGTAS